MESLTYLSGIAVILIFGILASILAKRLRTSNILFLILTGILVGNTGLRDLPIFQFSPTFLIAIAILTLVIIVFDGSSKFNFRELDALSAKSLEVVIVFIIFNLVLVTTMLGLFYGFTAQMILFGIILAVIMAGTDPASTFVLLGDKPLKALQFMKIEALINTPITVLLPFLLIDLLESTGSLFSTFIDFIKPFIAQIVNGIGVGIVLGIIVFKLMRKWYSESLSPIAVISTALLSYILAENLGGNGVLAVAILGLLFGRSYIIQKGSLQEFSSITASSLQILVFVLIGMLVQLSSDPYFWLASLSIFFITIVSRFLALSATVKEYNIPERTFMALNMPKGIAVAVVALSLALKNIDGFSVIVDLMIILTVYSLIVGTVTTYYSKYFLKLEIETK